MTFGQKIKDLRVKSNLTQKELAEKMNVTFQTVSKWESDTNEPDMANIKELAKIFNCSIQYLFDEDDVQIEKVEETKEESDEQVIEDETKAEETAPAVLVKCEKCGKEVPESDIKKYPVKNNDGDIVTVKKLCKDCYDDAIKLKSSSKVKTRPGILKGIGQRNDKKPLIWSIVFGCIALVITLIVCLTKNIEVGPSIGYSFAAGYTVLATIYCIATASYISGVFGEVASWSIRFPGIIFSFDLDGLMFLIGMKILFAVLGFLISVAVFILAVLLSSFLSVISFIPLFIYNKKHYEDL